MKQVEYKLDVSLIMLNMSIDLYEKAKETKDLAILHKILVEYRERFPECTEDLNEEYRLSVIEGFLTTEELKLEDYINRNKRLKNNIKNNNLVKQVEKRMAELEVTVDFCEKIGIPFF